MSTPTLAEVLTSHAYPGEVLSVFDEAWIKCGCGERIDVPVHGTAIRSDEVNDLWHAHVEAAVLAWVGDRLDGVREDVAQALQRAYNPSGDDWTPDADAALAVVRDALGVTR